MTNIVLALKETFTKLALQDYKTVMMLDNVVQNIPSDKPQNNIDYDL